MNEPRPIRLAILLPILLAAQALLLPASCAAERTASPLEDQSRADFTDFRGITVSCWGWGAEWATQDMRAVLQHLPSVGANWACIHPYAHVSRRTGEVRWSPDESLEHVRRPIRWAREAGIGIMIKPHISYWGEFSWRGEIGWGPDREDPRWKRFLESYRGWILHLAKACQEEGADLYVVGTELRKAEDLASYWRALIRDVRRVYEGPLTYASNWDDYERVPFWRELDYVGVQAYFPLTQAPDPSVEQLRRGWAGPIEAMRKVSKRVGRPVLLTEVGYSNTDVAASRPWESRGREAPAGLQERCLRTALEVTHAAPEIVGSFLWKWFPTTKPIGPRDFTVQTDGFKALLRQTWSREPEAGPQVSK